MTYARAHTRARTHTLTFAGFAGVDVGLEFTSSGRTIQTHPDQLIARQLWGRFVDRVKRCRVLS